MSVEGANQEAAKSQPAPWSRAGAPAADRIVLSGFAFYGHHGARAEEKTLGQRFVVDVELWLDLQPAGQADDLAQTVDYSRVYRAVKQVLEGPTRDLLEAVAERTAGELLETFERLQAVVVRVHKPGAPIAGSQVGSVMVEVSRRR